MAVSAPHASHWLNAIPIPSLGLKMDNRSLRIACGLRLGSPLCQPRKCICGTQVESTGVHGLSCRKSAGRFSRHFHVNNLIRKALEFALVPTILEPQGVSRTDGKRPDGMTIFPWRMEKCMVWDFTCSDTFASSHLEVSSDHFGKVAERAEQAKLTKYEQLERDFERLRTKSRKTKSRIGQNPEVQNPELDKIQNGQNPELDKIPNGQNPELDKIPNGQNPELDKIPNGQNPELDEIPNGQNPEWRKSRIGQNPELDKIQNRQNPELDKIPNGQNPELDKIPNWTKS